MGSDDQQELLLSQHHLTEDGNVQLYTGDGSVDLKGKPVLKNQTGTWRACRFILGTECCERVAYYAIARNLVTYLTTNLHDGNAAAARNVTTWQGTCYLTPLIGATIADAYWGKYQTIGVFSIIYLIGMAMLTLSASLPTLKPPACVGSVCPQPGVAQYAIFFVSLYLIALGTGGIKPCVSPFGADQFDDTDPVERSKKGSFFIWFHFSINIGALISGTVLVYIQDNYGWGLGFGIPTVFMGLAIGILFSGATIYRFQKPGGIPLARICQVIVASLCKWNIDVPEDSSLLYELMGNTSAIEGSRKLAHSVDYRFLDKAATISNLDEKYGNFSNPWRLCTVTQVEELKMLLRMLPIWASGIVFYAVDAQNSSTFLEQGMVMDKNVGSFSVPPASLSSFDVISIIIWLPIYDRVVVPLARRLTGNARGFSLLQRIGIGLFISILTMTAAALVEMKRLEIARSHDLIHRMVAAPMNIVWQLPQYFLSGAAEVFTYLAQLEFFYDQSPDAMRSLCSALQLVSVSMGSYLSSLILTAVTYITTWGGNPGWVPDNLNEGHLDRFFWLMAGISCLNLLAFIGCSMRYKCKKSA